MDRQLEAVAKSQGQWSATASALKARYEFFRNVVFGLSTFAALIAAASSQQPDGGLRTGLAIASALSLAVATFLTTRFLDTRQVQGWTRARAASEALKREGYKSAGKAAPYDDPATRDKNLRDEAQKIETDVDDLLTDRVPAGKSSLPTDVIDPDTYIRSRVAGATTWYEDKAIQYQASAKTLRVVEFVLALATTIITALMGSLPKFFAHFDFVALTAVLTTLSGAIIAYVEASRYDYLVTSYRATARRLRDAGSNAPPNAQAPSPAWSEYVTQCETIIQEETGAWMAKFGKK